MSALFDSSDFVPNTHLVRLSAARDRIIGAYKKCQTHINGGLIKPVFQKINRPFFGSNKSSRTSS